MAFDDEIHRIDAITPVDSGVRPPAPEAPKTVAPVTLAQERAAMPDDDAPGFFDTIKLALNVIAFLRGLFSTIQQGTSMKTFFQHWQSTLGMVVVALSPSILGSLPTTTATAVTGAATLALGLLAGNKPANWLKLALGYGLTLAQYGETVASSAGLKTACMIGASVLGGFVTDAKPLPPPSMPLTPAIAFLFAVVMGAVPAKAQTQFNTYFAGGAWYMNQSASQYAPGTLWYNTDDATLNILGADSTYRGTVRNQTVAGDLSGTLPNPSVVAITKFTLAYDSVRTVSFTANANKAVVAVDATAANVTVTLPSATATPGRCLTVFSRVVGGNKVIVKPGTSNYVSGSTTPDTITAQWKTRTYVAIDSNWVKIAND